MIRPGISEQTLNYGLLLSYEDIYCVPTVLQNFLGVKNAKILIKHFRRGHDVGYGQFRS